MSHDAIIASGDVSYDEIHNQIHRLQPEPEEAEKKNTPKFDKKLDDEKMNNIETKIYKEPLLNGDKKKENTDNKRTLKNIVTLKDIDIKIKHGEFVCIIGDVGSGKSSLLSALIGDLLYVSPDQITKYGGKYGFDKEIENDDEI